MCVINNKGNYLSYSLHQQITDVTACETWILETSSAFLKFDFTIVWNHLVFFYGPPSFSWKCSLKLECKHIIDM